jgi:hypothetical protein
MTIEVLVFVAFVLAILNSFMLGLALGRTEARRKEQK